MAKGIAAFVIVTALIMSMSILSGVGFYSSLALDYSSSVQDCSEANNEAVCNAADALIGQEATDRGSGSALEDFTSSAGTTLATGWEVLANLSGILQLLFPLPAVLTDTFQLFFQVIFGITFAGFIRGVVF